MRAMATRWTAVLLLGAAPVVAQASAGHVVALGGPITMHRQAVEEVVQSTGKTPVRLGGDGDHATAIAVSQHLHPDGAAVVHLASAEEFADALAAGQLLTGAGAALLLVDRDAVPEAAAAELARLAPDRVVVLGGPAAVSDGVLAHASQITGRAAERLWGQDRFATAAAISQVAHPDGADTVYVASGQDWPDALAATSALDAHGGALLLTAAGHLPTATAEALVGLAPSEVIVLGGPAAVSDPVLRHIGLVTDVTPSRLAGDTRYTTAQAITQHARPGGAAVTYAATGLDWHDALSAAPAIAAEDAALLLIDTTVVWPPPDLTPAIEVSQARAGTTSFAVIGTDGTLAGHQPERPVAAASTMKVMFLAAYLRQPSVRDRDLTEHDLALLEPMITQSANEPASTIADRLGPGPLVELAAESGMQDFAYTRPWGNSRTSARDQAGLMMTLEELLPPRHRAYAMELLTRVVPEQRWGIGQLALPGWQVHFKGGWGSGTGSVTHQVVLLQRAEGTAVALAVMTTSSPSHDYGTDTLEAVFDQLLATLP